MTNRTYGTFEYRPPKFAETRSRGMWVLVLEPAVRQRAKRVFGRLAPSKTTNLVMADSIEVARDIAWFMERFPLEPKDDRSARWLEQGAAEHMRQEQVIAEISAGTYQRRELPTKPLKDAREYQLAAVDLLRERGRMILTDDLGLGKTFTALLNLTHDDALPALVVCPTHLPSRWETELREAFPWLTVEIAKSTKPSLRVRSGMLRDVTIVSYSKLAGWAAELQNQVQTVIFDEAQELRHPKTDKSEAAAIVADNASYVQGLTATMIHNYGGEVFNIYDVIAPGVLGTREEFMREWGGHEMSNGRMTVKDPSVLGNYLREQGLMLGRTRAEVGRELPKTIKVPRLIDSDRKALDSIKGNVEALARLILADTATNTQKFNASGKIDMLLRQATGIDKAPYVAEFAKLLLQSEDRVIIWGWHREVYSIWMRELAEFNPVMYTGSESPKQKDAAIARFCSPLTSRRQFDDTGDEVLTDDVTRAAIDESRKASPDSRVMLMSLRSGAGIDGLQKFARVGVFGELDWSPATHEQAIGRLVRDDMGDEPVVAYFLNSAEGSDPAILARLQEKRMQAEPMLSKTGELREAATIDPGRARRLAEAVLGIKPPQPDVIAEGTRDAVGGELITGRFPLQTPTDAAGDGDIA